MLGRAVERRLRSDGVAVAGVDRDELDIADPGCVGHPVFQGARILYNCAAYTDVDGAESDEAAAQAINATGVAHLAAAAARRDALLVHVSTDYVFGGGATAPIPPDAPAAPRSAYGRTKRAGEEALIASGSRWLCVRTAWLFGHGGRNFVETMLRLGRERDCLQVVDDQRGSPTFADDLAAAMIALADARRTGVYQCTNSGETTWYGFAQAIFELAEMTVSVEPVASDAFPRPAPRPAYSVLDCTATEAALGRPLRPWREALAAYLATRTDD